MWYLKERDVGKGVCRKRVGVRTWSAEKKIFSREVRRYLKENFQLDIVLSPILIVSFCLEF